MAEPSTSWEGALNLCDLGGLPLDDGGSTVRGVVFRSGRREAVAGHGWRQAQCAGLATVLDLRNANEVGRRDSDPAADEAAMIGLHVINCPIEDQSNVEFMRLWGGALSHPRYYAANLEFFPDLMGRAFAVLAECSTAVLFHCSAGRDRTGLFAAMLLRLNGVTTEAILDDYENAVRRYNHALRFRAVDGGLEQVKTEPELSAAIAERRWALREWIETLDVGNYLRERALLPATAVDVLATLLRADRATC